MTRKNIIFREENPRINVVQLIGTTFGIAVLFGMGILLLLLLTGCSLIDEKTGDCPVEAKPGSAIAFMVSDSTASAQTVPGSTRTAQGTMTLDGDGGTKSLMEEGFGVFACHTGSHPYASTSTESNLMWNQRVAYDQVLHNEEVRNLFSLLPE